MNHKKAVINPLDHLLYDSHNGPMFLDAPITSPDDPVSNLPTVDSWKEFAELTWIRTSGKVAPFHPYNYQIELVESINDNPNTIVNKSRQTGVSETVCSYLLCRALTERGFSAVVFSKTQADASELGRRVRAMANSLQNETLAYLTDSTTQLAFDGRGTLYFLPASPRAARGIPSCSVLFLDEAAFLEGAAEIYRGAMPTLSMVGMKAKVIVVSTPNTEQDWFGQLWNSSEGDWNKVSLHYSQHPIYSADPEWANKTRKSRRMTQAAWDSEYELKFGATDTQIYPTDLVRRAARGQWQECGSINRDYILGIDPNAGGNDYFVALILDITKVPYEVVGMYRENGRSTEYSLRHVKNLIDDYIPNRIIIEKQAMGSVIAEALQNIVPKYTIETFSTSQPSKIIATDRVLYFLEHDELIYPKGIIEDELLAFQQRESGKREAATGSHDDIVMALSFSCSLIPETPNTQSFFENI